MALQGTLKDFGIADILQLIGQQQKTGTLHLRSKEREVSVGFKSGDIVKVESSTRHKKDLIGTMLVRAEIITEQELQNALERQKRSLQRLGDVLVASSSLSLERFNQLVELQAKETLFALFAWKTGKYVFQPGEVEYDPESFSPIRSDSILMEGFRRVDEWPQVQKRIPSYELTFQKLKELDPSRRVKGEEVTPSEEAAFAHAAPGRNVRKLIDLTCLGEFETCRALGNLVQWGYLKPIASAGGNTEPIQFLDVLGTRNVGWWGRVALALAVLGALAALGMFLDRSPVGIGGGSATTYTDPAAQRFVSRQQMARIRAAIELFRLEQGALPGELEALVNAGLLERGDLRHPWRDDYYYRPKGERDFVLLPPLR